MVSSVSWQVQSAIAYFTTSQTHLRRTLLTIFQNVGFLNCTQVPITQKPPMLNGPAVLPNKVVWFVWEALVGTLPSHTNHITLFGSTVQKAGPIEYWRLLLVNYGLLIASINYYNLYMYDVIELVHMIVRLLMQFFFMQTKPSISTMVKSVYNIKFIMETIMHCWR